MSVQKSCHSTTDIRTHIMQHFQTIEFLHLGYDANGENKKIQKHNFTLRLILLSEQKHH